MSSRKLSRTNRITITISSKLYKEILEYISKTQKFANYPDFASFAIQYFGLRFIYDVAPSVAYEIQKRTENGTQLEKLEFESEYTDENQTTQSTMAIGTVIQMSTFQHIFNQLETNNMLAYAVEYTYKCLLLRDSAIAKYISDKPDDSVFEKPAIKFKQLKK